MRGVLSKAHTLVDVRGVAFLLALLSLVLPISRRCSFRCLLGCLCALCQFGGGLGSGGGRGFASRVEAGLQCSMLALESRL